jgi:hypothetical protein
MGPWSRHLFCCTSHCVFKINDQGVSMYIYPPANLSDLVAVVKSQFLKEKPISAELS